MKQLIKSPIFNAICISIFSLFYTLLFFIYLRSSRFKSLLVSSDYIEKSSSLMESWKSFLLLNNHVYIAIILIILTCIIVALLILRRRPYDEYHTAILVHCLVISLILTLIAIAIFYLMILWNPYGILEKFTLFIVINWATVVISDLVFVLLCIWR